MADLELGPLRFGIVGAGRLGRAIGRALLANDFMVVAATCATEAGRTRAAHDLQVPVFDDPILATDGVDVVLLCVPDDAIGPVGAHIASARAQSTQPPQLRVVHTSGVVTLDQLDSLRGRGHDVLGVHPLQTVTDAPTPGVLDGAAAAVTAHDTPGRLFGHAFAHALNMHPFDLDDAHRALYHAASAVSANFTVTLQAMVRDLAAAAGLHEGVARNAFARLAHAAIDRVEREGPEAALTGPVVRGDTGTIEAHLAALEQATPQHATLYRELAHATVRVALAGGQLDIDRAARIDAVLANHTPT